MAKIFLILAALFSLASVGLGFANKGKLEESRAATVAKENELTATQGQLSETRDTLAATETAKAEAEANLENSRTELAGVKQELGAVQSKVQSLETEISTKTQEIADLNKKIEEMATPLSEDGTPSLVGAPAASEMVIELETLRQQLEVAQQEKANAVARMEVEQNRAQSLQAELRRRAEGVMARGLQGQVLAVNQAWGFVILSLGDRQGVAGNAEMLVRRGGSLIAKVRVTTVEPTTSVADIIPGTMAEGVRIQPGDTVIYPGASTRAPAAAPAAAPALPM